MFHLNFACWVIFYTFCCLLIFFKITFFKNLFQEENYQRVKWFESRSGTTLMLVLIWLQTVCKGYQETTKVPASNERVFNEMQGKAFGTIHSDKFFWYEACLRIFFLGHMQTVQTKNRRYRMWNLIRVSTAWSTECSIGI